MARGNRKVNKNIAAGHFILKSVLQGHLHDARVLRTVDDSKGAGSAERDARIVEADAVGQVEGLGACFEGVPLDDAELPHESQIELEKVRTENVVGSDVANCARGGLLEGRGIQPADARG